MTGPAQFQCSCKRGYDGDGFICIPVDVCQVDNGGCPPESTSCVFLAPGQVGAFTEVSKYDDPGSDCHCA